MSTARSSGRRGGRMPSVHSCLFAFHVKEILLDPSQNVDTSPSTTTANYKLVWELSDKFSDSQLLKPLENNGPSPGSSYTSPSFVLDNCRGINVDTAFTLLQCKRTKADKMGINGGSLNIRLVTDDDSETCIGSTTCDFGLLEVAATLNIHSFKLKGGNNNDSIVGAVDICYVSQQRWIKVNKRKLSFLNEQRTSDVKSVVETSANYLNSSLEGKKESTPSDKDQKSFSTFTPREDDFVLLFWNSVNTCFVKNHPDDYQLQLMLNFVRAPFITDGTVDSSRTDDTVPRSENGMSVDPSASVSQLNDCETCSTSRPVPNTGVFELPDALQQCANSDNCSSTPTSEMSSDYTDMETTERSEGTGRNKGESGAARLYDYLSEQNTLIQSQLTRQLSSDNMSTSSWTSYTHRSLDKDGGVPSARDDAANATTVPIPPLAFNIVDSCADNSGRTYRDVESDISSMSVSFRDSDRFSNAIGMGTSGNRSQQVAGSLNMSPSVGQANRTVKRVSHSDGFEVPSFVPRFPMTEKAAIAANESVSTFDADSVFATTHPSRSFNSFDLDAPAASGDTISGGEEGASKSLDVCSNVDSVMDVVSNLDIVEDMFCSVIIEDTASNPPMSGHSIDVDRFYAEKDAESGDYVASGSDDGSTIDSVYMDDVEMDSGLTNLIREATISPRTDYKNTLSTAIHNAILADISSLTVADLGVEHAECSLDVMSEALHDAKAMQLQQDRISNELLLNFFLQLLNCYSQKGVPQAMFMHNVVQKHLAAADLMKFLPEDYNGTVIRVGLDILIRQLSMELPGGKSDQLQLGTDYVTSQGTNSGGPNNRTLARSDTMHSDAVDRNSVDFFRPLSACDTLSEASDVEDCFLPTKDIHNSQLRMQQFQSILNGMYKQVDDMDPRKLVYISRLHSKPLKKRGCNLPLLEMKIVLYRVFCGRRKLTPYKARPMRV